MKTNYVKSFLVLGLTTLFFYTSSAQLTITTDGNVGVGVDNPLSKFSINTPGASRITSYILNTSSTSGSVGLRSAVTTPAPSSAGYLFTSIEGILTSGCGNAVGVYGQSYNPSVTSSGRAFGVFGAAGNATSGWNYGLYGSLMGSNNGAAVYGVTGSSDQEDTEGQFAGYFIGNVYVSDYLSVGMKEASYPIDVYGEVRADNVLVSSDERLKENITTIEDDIVYKLRQLKGVTYQLKLRQNAELAKVGGDDTTKQTNKVSTLNLVNNSKRHTGFIAQDVQKIYPELVYTDKDGMMSVDYIAFIPMIIEALKKQEELISSQAQEISALKVCLEDISTKTSTNTSSKSVLYQNAPNPFNTSTKIKYFLDENAKNAAIGIYNINGTVVAYKKIEAKTGDGEITIEKSELTPGIYTYILIVNDMELDSKRMVLSY